MTGEDIDVSVAKDGGILKCIKNEGNGQVTPDYGSQVCPLIFLNVTSIIGYCALYRNFAKWRTVRFFSWKRAF